MNDLTRTALHEAAHAVVGMSYGVACKELVIQRDGTGWCRWERDSVNLEHTLHAVLAGGVAVGAFCDDAPLADSSLEDLRQVQELAALLPPISKKAEQEVLRTVETLVWRLEDPIKALASLLAVVGKLTRDDLARAVHMADSPLAEFRGLYPRPAAARQPVGLAADDGTPVALASLPRDVQRNLKESFKRRGHDVAGVEIRRLANGQLRVLYPVAGYQSVTTSRIL